MSDVSDEDIRERLQFHLWMKGRVFQHYRTRNLYVVDAVSLMEEDMMTVMVTYHPADKPDMSFIRTQMNFLNIVDGLLPARPRFALYESAK